MKFSKRKSMLAVMLVMAGYGAVDASAQTVVQGGGSSLVGPSIQQEIVDFGGTLTYFITSSGAGQTAFLQNDPAAFEPSFTISGTIDFANSDAALLAAQVASYTNTGLGTSEGPLIQIPYIVTPITIPLVNAPAAPSGSTTPQTDPNNLHSIALNDTDLCGIFSGKITNWNQIVNPDTGSVYTTSSIPFQVVYRSDSSGTSELLTRHLSNVCPALTGSTVVTNGSTTTTVTFVDSTTFANTSAFPSGVPSNFVGASGSGGIHSTLVADQTAAGMPAAIAYLSPDWTNTFLATSSPSASAQLAVASLRNDILQQSEPAGSFADIAPTHTEADNAVSTAFPPGTTQNPASASDPTQWVPVSGTEYMALANPATGYPVSGTSQIIVSQCYADSSVTSAVTGFLTDHYTNSEFISVVQNNGFDIPTNFVSSIQSDFLEATRGNTLNIGNTTVCAGGKGR